MLSTLFPSHPPELIPLNFNFSYWAQHVGVSVFHWDYLHRVHNSGKSLLSFMSAKTRRNFILINRNIIVIVEEIIKGYFKKTRYIELDSYQMF